MVVMILTASPAGLRGDLTRWLEEVAPGVFVGHLSRRVRERVWVRVVDRIGSGRALMIFSSPGPQRFQYVSHGHDWIPTDFDGLTLMMRPVLNGQTPRGEQSKGKSESWSAAARLRRFGRDAEQLRREYRAPETK